MGAIDYALLALVGVCVCLALRRMRRGRRGCCGGGCDCGCGCDCGKSCGTKQKRRGQRASAK